MNLLLFLLLILAAGGGIYCLMRTFGSPQDRLPLSARWISELSLDRYRPMLRLLETEDLEFLRNQPGFSPSMVAQLRVQRCQVFRGYLRCLKADFARMCLALKLVLVQSENDRPELTANLLHQQFLFALTMLGVQFRVWLYRWGLAGVDASGLIRIFDSIRIELQDRVPAAFVEQA